MPNHRYNINNNNNNHRQRKKQRINYDNITSTRSTSSTSTGKLLRSLTSSDQYITTEEEEEGDSSSGEVENILRPSHNNNKSSRLRKNATSRNKFNSINSNRLNNNQSSNNNNNNNNILKRRNSLPRKQSPTLQSTSTSTSKKPSQSSNNYNLTSTTTSTSTPSNTLKTRHSTFPKIFNPTTTRQPQAFQSRPLRKSLHVQFSDRNQMVSSTHSNSNFNSNTGASTSASNSSKRLREPSGGTPIGRKSTRSSNSNSNGNGSKMMVLADQLPQERGKKRKREIVSLKRDSVDESEEEEEEEEVEEVDDDEFEDGEEAEEEGEGRRLRSADANPGDEEIEYGESDEGEEDLEEGEEEEEEEEGDGEMNEDDIDIETDNDQFYLFTANTTQLKRLKRAELARLYALATSERLSKVETIHKPSLVEGIIANRPVITDEELSGSEDDDEEVVDGEGEEEEAIASGEEEDEEDEEEGDDIDSPRPGTSHETSPVNPTVNTRRRGNTTASARAGRRGKTVGSGKSKLRNSITSNQDLPEDEEEEELEDKNEAGEDDEELGENDTVRDHASSSSSDEVTKPSIRFNKRGSQSLPGLSLTSIPPRRQLRNRSTGSAGSTSSHASSTLIFGIEASPVPIGRRLRNGKKVGSILGGGGGGGRGKSTQFQSLGALGEASGSGGESEEAEEQEEEEDTEEEEEEEEEVEMDGMSPPVATRTRHGAPSAPPKTSSHSNSTSPGAKRPGRIAKSKAVEKLGRKNSISKKGKEKAFNQDDNKDDQEMEVDEEEQNDEEEEEEEMISSGRKRKNGTTKIITTTTTRSGLRRSSQTSQPSDADDEEEEPESEEGLDPDEGEEEENEDEEDGEGDMSVEIVSHQRAATHLRNGKVVVLVPDEELEEEEEEGSENEMEVEGIEGEEEEEEEEGMADEDEDEDEGDLAHATSKSLLRRRRDDLIRLCEERDIILEKGTKKELVHALLEWRDNEQSSGESSSHSTVSGGSNATARGETKTQALRALPSLTTINGKTPLLMRPGHSYSTSPEKPHTLPQSKADEQEEVNALDLESLQLQDKEIAPDKLTRLEQVGSGGFKDVYKGIYRKKTVAISDIRGHLTEMDIKELGLLRDLRHPNIVHFIGVSIPKEPSSVPVMIVTELCANGDLFDYIRAVPCPAFSIMLDIMLGISKGVDYLHTRKPTIIHRDIKASNVLITAQGIAKINDFGLARVKTNARSMIRSLVGTVNYQAPELWTPNPRYNEKVDVYSVALVFWEVCQWNQAKKRYPFEGMNEHAIYSEAGQKKIRPSLIAARRVYGQGIADLIEAMWQADFHDRPSMSQVVLELQVLLTVEKEKERENRNR